MAAILVCSIQTVPAAVDDNLNSAFTILSSFLGINKKSSVPETKDIFDTASLVERVNYLEKQNRELSTAIQTSTNTIVEAVGESTAAATASYTLFVYFPASDALRSHEGVKVTITSPSGNQRASTTLKSSNGNYSGTLYFNFSGNCQLSWTATNAYNEHFDITEDITISNSSQEFKLGSVAHRLRVYFPKTAALSSYENENISLVVGSKTLSSKLRTKGSNYEAVFYSDYDSTAYLKYDFLDETGARVAIEEPINLTESQMSQEIGLNSMDPSMMSWRTIHTICQSNRASLFFEEGDILPDDFMIIGMRKYNGKDSLQIFRTKSIGRMNWNSAKSAAQSYCLTFNSEIAGFNMAYMSDLLTKSDLESGYFADSAKRCVADAWWTNTPCSTYQINYNSYGYNVLDEGTNSSYHLFVVTWANGSLGANVAGFTGDYNTNPYLWIY